jgi:Gram-negative bacterial TonB protein C-terminal
MRRSNLLVPIFVLACGTGILSGGTARTRTTSSLRSFYIVTHVFSDDLPSGYDEILEVVPQGADVCVRVIRISLANRYCGGQLVRAAERILPNTRVQEVTGNLDLCSYTEREVEEALKRAAPKAVQSIMDSASQNIVLSCSSQERAFGFPYPEEVDMKALQRRNPRVSELWALNYKVRGQAFGEQFSFQNLPPDKEKEAEDLGTKLLPELVSGKFEAGFSDHDCANQKCDSNYLAWRLKEYAGPPANRDPSSVELINAAALHLVHYDLPPFPALAKQTRLFGEVRLKIFPDAHTGLVKDVQQVSGHQLLGNVAIDAARKWRFSAGTQTDQPVEAVLEFSLCPDEQ